MKPANIFRLWWRTGPLHCWSSSDNHRPPTSASTATAGRLSQTARPNLSQAVEFGVLQLTPMYGLFEKTVFAGTTFAGGASASATALTAASAAAASPAMGASLGRTTPAGKQEWAAG